MLETLKSFLTIRNAIFFFSFVAGWPCVFYLMGWLPNYQINYIILLAICLIFVSTKQIPNIPDAVSKVVLIQIAVWVFYSIIHFDSSYYTRIILLVITYLILRMQYRDDSEDFIKTYDNWLTLQVICGALGVILVLMGLLAPLSKFVEMDGRTGYFFGLFTTNAFLGGMVRNAGFYDEPGALAFWGFFALLLNRMFVGNRKIEYCLIIGLLSTLSIAYYIQLTVYLLVFYGKKTWKLILLAAVVYVAIKYLASFNDGMHQSIYGRFEYDAATGRIQGDNRTVLMERCWNIFKDFPIFGIGARSLVGPEIQQTYGFVGGNFFFNWAADGIIGFIITYLPLWYIFKLGKFERDYYGVAILLLIGFLQRPYDSTQLLYPLLTYTILLNGYRQVID